LIERPAAFDEGWGGVHRGTAVPVPYRKEERVIGAKLSELELLEAGYENDPTTQVKANFPFSAATGTKNTAVVYFEVEPGHRLGTHTDSAEEILLILGGEAEVSVGDEPGQVSAGEMALVPAMVPHSVRNVGDETVRVVGFFSSSTVMSTFDQPVVPLGEPPSEPPFGQRTFLTPLPVALEQPPAPMAEAKAY
jgi:quercetin dioxygenase-like cupin family protein